MITFTSFNHSHSMLHWLLLLVLAISSVNAYSETEQPQTYIIHMDHSQKPASFSTSESWHRHTLSSLLSHGTNEEEELLLYSYNHVMNGFSARLTRPQLSEIEKSPAHLATYQESFGKLFTTYSPKFLGLNQERGLWPTASFGKGVIIGVIDSGVWPESQSFNDEGMPPAPRRWKGQCENGTAFTTSNCNRKLIGARSFSKGIKAAGGKISTEYDYDSPRDYLGHGTHTSSTAAGNQVFGESYFGYARGTASGVAPRAHVAMYKVLFASESAATDILAGMDQAIADGVDIMSLSIGFQKHSPYFQDVIAIASLSAIEKGIFVVCSAGNKGRRNSIHNGAPWITTVGAGTLDRSFTASLTLGNGLTVTGTSYFPMNVHITDAPVYYAKENETKAICCYGSLNKSEVHKKIIFCDFSTKVSASEQKEELERVGAYAGIISITGPPLFHPPEYTIPFLVLSNASGALVKEYVNGATTPKVRNVQFVSTNFNSKPAPQVAHFSSKGPDPINPGILKPDILAPGVDVLAAYKPGPFMKIGRYELTRDYALLSGTSMATPHVAGVAALLKNVHPEWSPAAIRSAMMTTAYNLDNTGNVLKDQLSGVAATPLEFGAGHINPNKSMDPGLIYDIDMQDYINFLCSLGYTKKQMSTLLRQSHWDCSKKKNDLNYPSFIAIFNNGTSSFKKKFTRVATNVGDNASIYTASLQVPSGMRVKVEPSALSFT